MQPSEYYRWKSAEIKEADIRLVASCMSEHIGQDNAVKLEVLVKDYKWPIGAHAGKAGRWIIATEEERWHVTNELLSRENEIRMRRKAIEQAQLPAKLDLEQAPQMGLFGG